jgi:Skp family chaperone for outer membrane proteins
MRRYIPWLLAALCALALIWVLYGQNASLEQIGLIDMGKVLSESEYAQRLNEQLAEKYDQLIAQLQSSDTEGIDEETRADQERAVYAEYLRFRQELETEFQAALAKAISEAAEEADLQLVLDVDLVRYGGKDISSEVIKRLR